MFSKQTIDIIENIKNDILENLQKLKNDTKNTQKPKIKSHVKGLK